MLPHHRKLLTTVGGGAFNVEAVTFDGTNDYLSRGSDLTGNADGKEGTVSFWVKNNLTTGTSRLIDSTQGGFEIRITNDSATTIIRIIGYDSSGNQDLLMTSDAFPNNIWVNIIASWDLANNIGQIYIDDLEKQDGTASINNDNINYTNSDIFIGAEQSGAAKIGCDLAELYVNFTEHIDLSVVANRRKFISADGKPVNLGVDGSLPTGTAPIIYLSNREGDAASDFATNRGSGGNFSISGALATASTSPSD